MGDHGTLATVGIVLILAVLLIGSGVLIWHRNKVFTDKPVPVPEQDLAWTRWDVVLTVCLVLCALGAVIDTHLDDPWWVPILAINIVIHARNYYRRRKAKQACRNAEGVDP